MREYGLDVDIGERLTQLFIFGIYIIFRYFEFSSKVGGTGCGKTSVVHLLAKLAGQKLRSIAVNSTMDTTELLGGFEQVSENKTMIDNCNYKDSALLIEYEFLKQQQKSCILK